MRFRAYKRRVGEPLKWIRTGRNNRNLGTDDLRFDVHIYATERIRKRDLRSDKSLRWRLGRNGNIKTEYRMEIGCGLNTLWRLTLTELDCDFGNWTIPPCGARTMRKCWMEGARNVVAQWTDRTLANTDYDLRTWQTRLSASAERLGQLYSTCKSTAQKYFSRAEIPRGSIKMRDCRMPGTKTDRSTKKNVGKKYVLAIENYEFRWPVGAD